MQVYTFNHNYWNILHIIKTTRPSIKIQSILKTASNKLTWLLQYYVHEVYAVIVTLLSLYLYHTSSDVCKQIDNPADAVFPSYPLKTIHLLKHIYNK